jgi:acetyltransferase-like isoleucine patch superfamily enzyme
MRSTLVKIYNSLINSLGSFIGSIILSRLQKKRLYFPHFSETLSHIPFSFGWKLRYAVYKKVLPQIGEDVLLSFGVIIDDPNTRIGNDVWINTNAYIEHAEIGDYAMIGMQAILLAGGKQHNTDCTDIPIKLQGPPLKKEPLRIGDGVWIGANATVMADVGNHAIVGAGSVVTKPVPPFAVVAGNPAKILRMRDDSLPVSPLKAVAKNATNVSES